MVLKLSIIMQIMVCLLFIDKGKSSNQEQNKQE
jgi:hypothetical protein